MVTFLAIKVLEPFSIQSISFHSFCILTRFCELDHVLESVAVCLCALFRDTSQPGTETVHIAIRKKIIVTNLYD